MSDGPDFCKNEAQKILANNPLRVEKGLVWDSVVGNVAEVVGQFNQGVFLSDNRCKTKLGDFAGEKWNEATVLKAAQALATSAVTVSEAPAPTGSTLIAPAQQDYAAAVKRRVDRGVEGL
jgi:hypothetical protein